MKMNYEDDLVSVIMPVYNASDTVSGSIRSVLSQTRANLELITVDDGSSDTSVSIIETIAASDPRIQLIRSEQNAGIAAARNRGILAAKGRYIAFLDSDDLWRPEKLEQQIAFMQLHQAALSATAYGIIDAKGNKAGSDRFPPAESMDYQKMLRGNPLGCLTVLIDRMELEKQGFHHPLSFPIIRHEDYALWLSITKCGIPAWGLQEVLADYRVDNASASGNKLRSAKWTYEIYRNYLGLGRLKSISCFFSYLLEAVRKRS